MPRCQQCHRRFSRGSGCPQHGSPLAPKDSEAQADLASPPIAGYQLGELLGSGGFACVVAARRETDGKEVAVKVTHESTEVAAGRLAQEAEALRRLGPPHTPEHIEDGVLSDGRGYLVMERVVGVPLSQVLETSSLPLPLPAIEQLCKGMLACLGASHRAGLIHRDLKPENIMLDAGPSLGIRLLDYGLAIDVSPAAKRHTRAGLHVGTAAYSAPEQLTSSTVDTRADIYSFGVVLYEMLTLRTPFVGDRATIEHGHLAMRPPRPSQFAPVPETVESLVLACLAKAPEKRPASCDELETAIERAWPANPNKAVTMSGTRPISLMATKRQPTVILATIGDGSDDTTEVIPRHGGLIARLHGSQAISIFPSFQNDDPLGAAIAAARELVGNDETRAAIHLAPIAIRRSRRRARVVGEDIDRPDVWLPPHPWTGIALTDEVARGQSKHATELLSTLPGFHQLVDSLVAAELVGRDEEIESASAWIDDCLDTTSPGLLTVIGDNGTGKSRFAAKLVELGSARIDASKVLLVDGGGTEAGAQINSFLDKAGALAGRCRPARSATPRMLIVDDAHRLEPEVLDAIEYATLDRQESPLCIAVIAAPLLEEVRHRWGERANRHNRTALGRLDAESAMALAAECLKPAEYPPAAFLRQLAEWSDGNPAVLISIISALKQQGYVRRREHGDGWYVASEELDTLPAQAPNQWLVARDLEAMTPELGACAKVCAVLGATFFRDELLWVTDAIARTGGAGTSMDPDVGLGQLIRHGTIIAIGDTQLAFTSSFYQDALYKLLDDDERRRIHDDAAQMWQLRVESGSSGPMALERFARHAGAAGLSEEAAHACLDLAAAAADMHRYVDADRHCGGVLRQAKDPEVRAKAFAIRGRARALLHRTGDSLADLRAARDLHTERGEHLARAEVLLDEATVFDSSGDFSSAEKCGLEATPIIERAGDKGHRARLLLATGRTLWRKGLCEQAIEDLEGAAAGAAAAGDTDTEICALLLLGPALVSVHDLPRGAGVFERVLARCRDTGDVLHECAALGNRMVLWSAQQQLERATSDLRECIRLARELGNPEPERVATHNLAELLYWSGEFDESLALARRSRALQLRFFESVPDDALLLARIHAARGEIAETRKLLDQIETECDERQVHATAALLREMLELVIDVSDNQTLRRDRWDSLIARVEEQLPAAELLEATWWRAELASRWQDVDEAQRHLDRANPHLAHAPIWEPRFRQLSQSLDCR